MHTSDLASMRHFYTEVLGLREIYASDAEGTVGYRIGDLQLALIQNAAAAPVEHWAKQLGWQGGESATPSWGFELDPESFRNAVGAAIAAEVPARYRQPSWVGYWSFPLRDPMGHTVEVSAADRTAWPGDLPASPTD